MAIAFLKNNSLHINAFYNWSGCTKLSLRATWTHGLTAQLVRTSEQNSVIVGSSPISIRPTFYSSYLGLFGGEYHMYQFLLLHWYDYLYKISIKWAWRLTKAMAEMKSNTEQVMKLEWLLKAGSDWSWTHGQRAHLVKFSEGNTVVLGLNTTQANFLQLLLGIV